MHKTRTAAKRYNKRMDDIFATAKRLNERNDFIRFMEANPHLTLDTAYKVLQVTRRNAGVLMKVDGRRIRVFYSKGLKSWAADYPYPGMERMLGYKQYFMVTSNNAANAKAKLIKQLKEKFNLA